MGKQSVGKRKWAIVRIPLESCRQYRAVDFRIKGTSNKDVRLVLEKFSNSIQDLKIRNDIRNLRLPKLRKIMLIRTGNLHPDGILSTNIQHIEDLDASYQKVLKKNVKTLLKEAVKGMSSNLKALGIQNSGFDEKFHFPKLESLILDYRDLTCPQLAAIMMEIPNLRILKMEGYCKDDAILSMDLSANYSIKELECTSEFAKNHLAAFKSLEYLYSLFIDEELFEMILESPTINKVEFGRLLFDDDFSNEENLNAIRRMKEQNRIEFVYEYGSLEDLEEKLSSEIFYY